MAKPCTRTIYPLVCGLLISLAVGVDSLSAQAGDKGVHIKSAGTVSFRSGYCVMVDGGGYRWDLQNFGNVYKGQDYAYTGAMYCKVSGENVRSVNYSGKKNSAGDEIEIGPYPRAGLNCWRRIKIYRDSPLARWLDVFTNPSSRAITVPVSIYSSMRYGFREITSSSGGKSFGKKDWAFFSTPGRASAPSSLHVVCSRRAKLRPRVEITGTLMRVNYTLTVPAKETVILCHFESQNRQTKALASMMKNFRFSRVLGDLPASVRSRILNVSSTGFSGFVDLERSEKNDTVILTNGDPIYGIIENDSFSIDALAGRIDLPAKRIVGMTASKGGGFRVAIVGGEVLSGPITETPALKVRLPAGGTLAIPLVRVRQWSYRLSKSRPDEDAVTGAYVVSVKGDRLKLSGDPMTVKFRTRHGPVALDSKHLLSIVPVKSSKTEVVVASRPRGDKAATRPGARLRITHKAALINGSVLSGSFVGDKVKLKLRDGRELAPAPGQLAGLYFADDIEPNTLLSSVELIDGDKVFGRLSAARFHVVTQYGGVELGRTRLRSVKFKPGRPDSAVFKLRNSTVLKGRLADVALEIKIAPRTKLKLTRELLSVVDCPMPLPAEAMIALVEQLVAQLGAESSLDRKSAVERLAELGPGISPVLRRYLRFGDPAVRGGIWQVMIKLGTDGTRNPQPAAPLNPFMHMHERGFGGFGLVP